MLRDCPFVSTFLRVNTGGKTQRRSKRLLISLSYILTAYQLGLRLKLNLKGMASPVNRSGSTFRPELMAPTYQKGIMLKFALGGRRWKSSGYKL
jgi:hypothetical protein